MNGKKSPSLADIRAKYRLTQQEVADLLGISMRSYQDYENGKGNPDKERGYMERLQRELDAGGISHAMEPVGQYPSLEARLADVERRLKLVELILTKQ